jgi:HEPN domain-containing protein
MPTQLTRDDFRQIARARLKDAKALLAGKRYDGGLYLCGYAVEMALKARICRTLSWDVWPKEYKTFWTHDLDVLLNLTGREKPIKANLMAEWSIATKWEAGMRYLPPGQATAVELKKMIDATSVLLKALL